jgi:hypothetical protein
MSAVLLKQKVRDDRRVLGAYEKAQILNMLRKIKHAEETILLCKHQALSK